MTPVMVECDVCGEEYEEHPLALHPHVCPSCEEESTDAVQVATLIERAANRLATSE